VKDGQADFSKYTHEQIARSLGRIDRERYPLNYANLLAAQRALPVLPMDEASVVARQNSLLLEKVVAGNVWISAPAWMTFWLPCLSRAVVRGANLEIRSPFSRWEMRVTDIARVRWFDAQPMGEWHLAVIEFRHGSPIRLLPRSRAVMRMFAAYAGKVQGGIDVADPEYASVFFVGAGD
jgi:hypothetical protein